MRRDLIEAAAIRLDPAAAATLAEAALNRAAYLARHGGKDCARCGQTKPLAAFSRDGRRPDGRASSCLACEADRARRARANRTKDNPHG